MFNIYKVKKSLSFLPSPILRLMQIAWQKMRTAITYLYFKTRFPNTKLILSNKSGHGQFGQSSIIDALLKGKRNGYFVDIGANHPLNNSNSAFFERERDYSGIAFDPIASYVEDWKKIRPNTKFIQAAVGESTGKIYFYKVEKKDGWEDQLSYVSNTYEKPGIGQPEPEIVEVLAIKNIKFPHIDFASIDVEGHEVSVLNGMFPDVKPSVLLIENCGFPFGNNKIREIAIANGYSFYARIGYIDDLYILKSNR